MKPVLNPPDDLNVLASITLDVRLTMQGDDDPPQTRSLKRDVIFNALAWESEIFWQAVQAIVDKHGGSTEEALEALEAAAAALKSTRSSR